MGAATKGPGSRSKQTQNLDIYSEASFTFYFPDYFSFFTLLLCLHFIQPPDSYFSCHCLANGSTKFRWCGPIAGKHSSIRWHLASFLVLQPHFCNRQDRSNTRRSHLCWAILIHAHCIQHGWGRNCRNSVRRTLLGVHEVRDLLLCLMKSQLSLFLLMHCSGFSVALIHQILVHNVHLLLPFSTSILLFQSPDQPELLFDVMAISKGGSPATTVGYNFGIQLYRYIKLPNI